MNVYDRSGFNDYVRQRAIHITQDNLADYRARTENGLHPEKRDRNKPIFFDDVFKQEKPKRVLGKASIAFGLCTAVGSFGLGFPVSSAALTCAAAEATLTAAIYGLHSI